MSWKTLNKEELAAHIAKHLAEIMRSLPTAMLNSAVSEVPFTPTVDLVIQKALEDPDFPEEKKEALRGLQAMGQFDKTMPVENERITKVLDKMIERAIQKKIKAGLLPPRNQIKNLPHIKDMFARAQKS